MIVAHSMGAIVAYDVLRLIGQRSPDTQIPVPHLVTIGAPLGLTPVKGEILKAHNGRLRTPSVVTRAWANFSDPDDYVCLDTHLADDYDSNSSGIEVRDRLVHNDYADNPHKSYGYLRTPELSEHVARFL